MREKVCLTESDNVCRGVEALDEDAGMIFG